MDSSEAYLPTAEDFSPIINQESIEQETRPSLSYWQDAWRRLKQNKRALCSFYLIVFLLLFTIVGPLLWQVDPTLQDLDRISQSPALGVDAIIVEDPGIWEGVHHLNSIPDDQPVELARTESISFVGQPSTQYVRLQWQAVPGALNYLVYRNDHFPESENDLGLPLGRTLLPTQVSWEDRLQLQPIEYFYTIIATDGFVESSQKLTQSIAVPLGISKTQAYTLNDEGIVGNLIRLSAHPFGTDYLGRDMLARTMVGARVSLFIGIIAPLIFVLFGTLYGGIAGYVGGRIDNLMMRFADFIIALPFLLFMILFRIGFGIGPGESGIFPLLLALIVLRWPDTARIVRGQVLQIRNEAFVQASRVLGAKPGYLIFRHMLPNTMGAVLVTFTFAVPMAIFTEAFLSFIGMGVAPPTPSWGSMSNEGIRTMLSSPHELLFPAVFISITVLAFNLFGDGLRDALDSKLRSTD